MHAVSSRGVGTSLLLGKGTAGASLCCMIVMQAVLTTGNRTLADLDLGWKPLCDRPYTGGSSCQIGPCVLHCIVWRLVNVNTCE